MAEERIEGYCEHCEKEIPDGYPCVTISRHTEVIGRGAVDVKSAGTAVMLCTTSGMGISEGGLRRYVQDHLSSLEAP